MKKYILVSIIVLAAWWVLGSAQPTEAATINAASCSYADVSAEVTAALPKDTVQVPAGNCTWSNTLSITKGINLIGAGIGNTVITSTQKPVIDYLPADANLDANYHLRISGFTFDLGGSGRGIHLHNKNHFPPQSNIRIDHNRFYNSTTTGGGIEAWGVRGVIDNNIFDSVTTIPTRVGWGDNLLSWQNYPEVVFGTGKVGNVYDNLYVEDNTYSGLSCAQELFSDGDEGGRYVFRYNTTTIPNGDWCSAWDMHGGRWTLYGTMGAEVYGNQITGNSEGRLMAQRGGRLVLFYNNWTTTRTIDSDLYQVDGCPPGTDPIYSAQLINSSYYWNNRTNFSGNVVNISSTDYTNTCLADPIVENSSYWHDASPFTGATGVGCGTLAARPTTCTTGVAYWATNQSCSDLNGMVGVNPATPISGTLYKCTSTNTWTAYYTPLTYPHPLRSETPQTCTYTYSAWGTCQPNNTQTRTVISSSPSGCTGTPILTQSCVYTNFLPEQYIQAESGTLSSPMQTGSNSSASGGRYVYTPTDYQGAVSFTFSLTQSGQYRMEALVNSNNDAGQDSFYVGLDSENAQNNNYYVYDTPVISGYVWNNVNRRGNGTALPEFDPMIWNLTAGIHTFTFYGRESNTWLDQIILKRVTADTTPPAAPTGVIVN